MNREHGITIFGPDPGTLIDPVSPAMIKGSVCAYLRDWWVPMMDNPVRLEDSEYQTYAVLSMCRAQYTLKYGRIASKRQSALWLATEAPGFSDLITHALNSRLTYASRSTSHGSSSSGSILLTGLTTPGLVSLTQSLIQSTLSLIR